MTYQPAAGVTEVALVGRPGWRTPQGGHIAGDAALMRIWHDPDAAGDTPVARAALACLAEAGLLTRTPDHPSIARPPAPVAGPRVSVVLVVYDSEAWIDECLQSLLEQTYTNIEIVVVDNGSTHDPTPQVRRWCPDAPVVRQSRGASFASALNAGARAATGDALFMLNPDVALEPDAVAQLVAALDTSPQVAAVAAKLRFHWARGFLNGLGNRVQAWSWGSDNAIGHLDLGQFDARRDVPSACFGAALLSRRAWEAVGPVDAGFPMYYEDVAWSYRARRLGWTIVSAPDAIVYHAFGSRLANPDEPGLTPRKLAHAAYGRLRFASTVLDGATRRRYLRAYLREDLGNYRIVSRQGDTASAAAYRQAWRRAAGDVLEWRRMSRRLTRDASVPSETLMSADAAWPDGLIWNGVPELTEPIVTHTYLPLLLAGATRLVPEFPR